MNLILGFTDWSSRRCPWGRRPWETILLVFGIRSIFWGKKTGQHMAFCVRCVHLREEVRVIWALRGAAWWGVGKDAGESPTPRPLLVNGLHLQPWKSPKTGFLVRVHIQMTIKAVLKGCRSCLIGKCASPCGTDESPCTLQWGGAWTDPDVESDSGQKHLPC